MKGVDASLELPGLLTEERVRVEAALERALDGLPAFLPDELGAPLRAGVLSGGKRLRPILCVAAYRAAGGRRGDADNLYDLAVSLELIHAYSLMHDDLPCMDDAPLRRGTPTPHTRFGERRTMVAGAALIPLAGLQLWGGAVALGVPEVDARELLRLLARAAGGGGMVGGQALDLEAEGRILSREELDGLHRRKTGALLAASLEMGAVAAGAAPPVREALALYGRAVGLAFQIADDVLDATASAEVLGKAPSDVHLEKSTYVALLGVEGARAAAAGKIQDAVAALASAPLRPREASILEALGRYVVARDR